MCLGTGPLAKADKYCAWLCCKQSLPVASRIDSEQFIKEMCFGGNTGSEQDALQLPDHAHDLDALECGVGSPVIEILHGGDRLSRPAVSHPSACG
jgi:hypothetical protein